MKTPKRLDEEIKAITKIWNSCNDLDPSSEINKRISDVCHTLRWARGKREPLPSSTVRRIVERSHWLDK